MLSRSAIVLGVLGTLLPGCDAADAAAQDDRDHLDLDLDLASAAPGKICDLVAYPSVYFIPVRVYDDFTLLVDVDAVWYEHEGTVREAACLPDHAGGCRAWVAGWELEGEIRVSTEYCDVVVDSDPIFVPIDDEGCHVVTQYVLQPVSTRGCLAVEDDTPQI
jgi:hypothetical protein